MDSNINAQIMLDLNQKVKELIMTDNIQLLGELFQKYNILFQPIDANNLTVLHFAVQMSKPKTLLYLTKLMSPQGMNIPDIFGRTPLHQAAAKGDIESILILIEYGADINAKSISGETPLMKAIAFYQVEATKILLRLGADPKMRNEVTGKNCLYQAYESGNNDIINYVKLYNEKYFDIIKKIMKIGNKEYSQKNHLQKLPDLVLRNVTNFLIP